MRAMFTILNQKKKSFAERSSSQNSYIREIDVF